MKSANVIVKLFFVIFLFPIVSFSLPVITVGNQTVPENITEASVNRTARFILSSLFRNSETMSSCIPQLMCEIVSAAEEPTDKTDSVNDYKYLLKELFLKSDDDDNESGGEGKRKFRTEVLKKTRKNVGSSSEESASLNSKEVKTNGAAELMKLQEEDEIENLAVDDIMNGGDPNDLFFALADVKRKQKLKQMVHEKLNNGNGNSKNNYNYTPEKGIWKRRRRIIRSLKRRKVKFTNKPELLLDGRDQIIRMARKIGKSGRQCRSLFSSRSGRNSCPSMSNANTKGVKDFLKSLQNQNGEGSSGISSSDMKEMLQTLLLQSQNRGGGGPSDVKVFLNIGGGPGPGQGGMGMVTPPPTMQQQSGGSMFMTQPISMPMPMPITQHRPDWPILLPTTLWPTTKRPNIVSTKKPLLKTISPLHKKILRTKYKAALQNATKILEHLPQIFPRKKNGENATNNNKSQMNQQKISTKMKTRDKHLRLSNSLQESVINTKSKSNIGSDSDSQSVESSEEEFSIFPAQISLPFMRQRRILLTSIPYNTRNDPLITSASNTNDKRKRGPSFIERIYDMFFKERRVMQLPEHPNQWVPSAIRHSHGKMGYYQNQNHHQGGSYYPLQMPQRIPQPQKHETIKKKPKVKTKSKKNEIITPRIQTKKRGPLKYKSCCGKNHKS